MKKIKWKVLRKKIEQMEFNPKGEKFYFACCDCGLVHTIAIAIEKNGKIGMAFKRNQKLTLQNRNSWKK